MPELSCTQVHKHRPKGQYYCQYYPTLLTTRVVPSRPRNQGPEYEQRNNPKGTASVLYGETDKPTGKRHLVAHLRVKVAEATARGTVSVKANRLLAAAVAAATHVEQMHNASVATWCDSRSD